MVDVLACYLATKPRALSQGLLISRCLRLKFLILYDYPHVPKLGTWLFCEATARAIRL